MGWIDALFGTSSQGKPAPKKKAAAKVGPLQREYHQHFDRPSPQPDRYSPVVAPEKGKKARGKSNPETGHVSRRDMRSMSREADWLLRDLFAYHDRTYPGIPVPDRLGDRVLDAVDFFNPWSGTPEERRQRAMDEWTRRVYRPALRLQQRQARKLGGASQ